MIEESNSESIFYILNSQFLLVVQHVLKMDCSKYMLIDPLGAMEYNPFFSHRL